MNEMVERLAKVLATEIGRRIDARVKADDFGTLPIAKAVLEAMREPTEAMVTAGIASPFIDTEDFALVSAWHAMIDAALAENSHA